MLAHPHLGFQLTLLSYRLKAQIPMERSLEAAAHTSPVPPGIVQSAAGPQRLIVIVAPAQEGQCCPEGRGQGAGVVSAGDLPGYGAEQRRWNVNLCVWMG